MDFGHFHVLLKVQLVPYWIRLSIIRGEKIVQCRFQTWCNEATLTAMQLIVEQRNWRLDVDRWKKEHILLFLFSPILITIRPSYLQVSSRSTMPTVPLKLNHIYKMEWKDEFQFFEIKEMTNERRQKTTVKLGSD